MNFLAHAYLSGNYKDLIIGNFIADSVKGKEFENYTEGIKNGILLHRKIDAFTDSHPIVIKTIEKLKPHFNRYSSVVSDIYYDHFLSLYWNTYSAIPLQQYTNHIYTTIEEEKSALPAELMQFFPYMVRNNWLFNYQTFYGLGLTFEGMSRRTSFPSNMENAVTVLKNHYSAFEEEFHSFFPILAAYSIEERIKLGYL